MDPAIEPGELAALARKYATMRGLRRAGADAIARATLRAFAAEFPGALAETDRIADALLDARVDESARLARTARGGSLAASAVPQWAHAWVLVHRALRGALAVKRRLAGARTRALDPSTRAALRDAIERDGTSDERAWLDRLDEVAAPPGGRLLDRVLADVAAALAIEGDPRALLMPRGAPAERG